ncbi:hypothetical protein [Sphaerotilus mobilis]|uniref:C-di-GMP-related signal transduction protein n=1 Tax=Sphaerotilus mobilis TaxID=47994 RepID=A0A4Q7LHJ0_9BURK|nr:hypothetical protein [Sphaerotilus mobilis]RZS52898.1 c-di-GMP-related signal transduction protein [Sphaerotilus mobilis]
MPTAPLSRADAPIRQPAALGDNAHPLAKRAGPSQAAPLVLQPAASPKPQAEGLMVDLDAALATSPPLETSAAVAASSTPLPAATTHLNLPRVAVRTTKVVNMLGHEVAVQLLPVVDLPLRGGSGVRGGGGLNEWIDNLCHTVLALGLRSVAGAHPVLIEVSEALLLTSLVEVLDPRWAVVQLPSHLPPTPLIRERLKELRARGLVLSLSCNGASSSARLQTLTHQVQWAHLDIGTHERTALLGLWPELIGQQVHLRGIDRLDDFREYRTLGVHAYSGPLLSAPVTWTVDQLPACDANGLHHLRERLLRGADDVELAALVDRDPALLLRLLILACDGLFGAISRPESTLDLVSRLRGPTWPIWLELLYFEARDHAAALRPAWCEAAAHLSLFMRLLSERLAPDRHELHRQAALLGMVAHFRHTLPARMVGHLATPLMCPAIEDAWMHRQCLLGAVLDIGLRLMFNGQAMAPANGIVELYDEAGRQVRERSLSVAGHPGLPVDSRA